MYNGFSFRGALNVLFWYVKNQTKVFQKNAALTR